MPVKTWTIRQLPVMDIGQSIQIAGLAFADTEIIYVCLLPDEEPKEIRLVQLTPDDWQRILRQSDLVETELFARNPDGTLVKALTRKCERQISQAVSWSVMRRDGFRCRYCGRDDVPLTVDHLVPWEDGGSSVPENLVAACRKCNGIRGTLPYAEWLESPRYKCVSQNLAEEAHRQNTDIVASHQLEAIPIHVHKRSR